MLRPRTSAIRAHEMGHLNQNQITNKNQKVSPRYVEDLLKNLVRYRITVKSQLTLSLLKLYFNERALSVLHILLNETPVTNSSDFQKKTTVVEKVTVDTTEQVISAPEPAKNTANNDEFASFIPCNRWPGDDSLSSSSDESFNLVWVTDPALKNSLHVNKSKSMQSSFLEANEDELLFVLDDEWNDEIPEPSLPLPQTIQNDLDEMDLAVEEFEQMQSVIDEIIEGFFSQEMMQIAEEGIDDEIMKTLIVNQDIDFAFGIDDEVVMLTKSEPVITPLSISTKTPFTNFWSSPAPLSRPSSALTQAFSFQLIENMTKAQHTECEVDHHDEIFKMDEDLTKQKALESKAVKKSPISVTDGINSPQTVKEDNNDNKRISFLKHGHHSNSAFFDFKNQQNSFKSGGPDISSHYLNSKLFN